MREKKEYVIVTFHTTTEAMAFERQCNQFAIKGRLIPVPTQITAGCGLAWRILASEYPIEEEKIKKQNLKFDKTYVVIL